MQLRTVIGSLKEQIAALESIAAELELEDARPSVPSSPALEIVLPYDSPAALNAYYGTATKSGSGYLTRFSFPVEEVRLYSRGGAKLRDLSGDEYPDHSCHKSVKASLEAALLELLQVLGLDEFRRQGWYVYSGCFNYRQTTSGGRLSTHSWAIAVDFNSTENPFAQRTTTFSAEAINVLEKHGWLSGGRAWGKDWMHFQRAIPSISAGSYYATYGLPKHIKPA